MVEVLPFLPSQDTYLNKIFGEKFIVAKNNFIATFDIYISSFVFFFA